MKILKYIFSFFVVCLIAVFIYVAYLFTNADTQGYTFKEYKPPLTTQIYDRNGKLVANIFEQHRFYASYEELPPRLIEALVAIEDTSFFEHDGVNIDAIFRAIVKIIRSGGKTMEGASTLTQQFIKNTELTPERTITRKIREALLAYKMETILSKEQILERYLNYIFFGHGYYGVKTAAQGYFHKNLNELSLKEIAMLVGMPKAPSSYDPTKHLDLSIARANNVIARMYTLGWISKAEYDEAMKENCSNYICINGESVPNIYKVFNYMIFGQMFGYLSSLKLNISPDNPRPDGTVNRVVKGVVIHQYK